MRQYSNVKRTKWNFKKGALFVGNSKGIVPWLNTGSKGRILTWDAHLHLQLTCKFYLVTIRSWYRRGIRGEFYLLLKYKRCFYQFLGVNPSCTSLATVNIAYFIPIHYSTNPSQCIVTRRYSARRLPWLCFHYTANQYFFLYLYF
jgi:hypothetical protein